MQAVDLPNYETLAARIANAERYGLEVTREERNLMTLYLAQRKQQPEPKRRWGDSERMSWDARAKP